MSKYKPFALFEGDTVWFKNPAGGLHKGTLVKRPYGRRLFAIVKNEQGRLVYLPNREHIVRKVVDEPADA